MVDSPINIGRYPRINFPLFCGVCQPLPNILCVRASLCVRLALRIPARQRSAPQYVGDHIVQDFALTIESCDFFELCQCVARLCQYLDVYEDFFCGATPLSRDFF